MNTDTQTSCIKGNFNKPELYLSTDIIYNPAIKESILFESGRHLKNFCPFPHYFVYAKGSVK